MFDVGEVFTGKVREFRCRATGKENPQELQQQLDRAVAALVERYQRWWFPGVQTDEAAVDIDGDDADGDLLRISAGPGALTSWISTPPGLLHGCHSINDKSMTNQMTHGSQEHMRVRSQMTPDAPHQMQTQSRDS